MAIRDNRIAAESVGINITKFQADGIHDLCGDCGSGRRALCAQPFHGYGDAGELRYNMSIMILVFVVLGGMGNFRGSIIAAVLLTLLPEVLREDCPITTYVNLLDRADRHDAFNWAPKCIEWRQKMAQKFRKNTKKEAV